MPTGVLMGGKNKPAPPSPSDGGGDGGSGGEQSEVELVFADGEFTEQVKLRRPFKLKLQHVAQHNKKAMGQLIEEMMSSAINREYKQITGG
jgi:hypothetical protein